MSTERGKILTDPEVIDFGIGQPQPELLPREMIWRATNAVLSEGDHSVLNYGHPKGDGAFREALGTFLSGRYGCPVDPGSLLTTNGASQALHLITQVFAKPGETILVEEPTYFLAHKIFSDRGLKVVGVPLGGNGWDPKVLEKAIKKHRPALFYSIPTYQNPTGRTLSWENRKHLVEMARRHNFLVVADEVYQLLSYGPPPPPPMAAFLESDRVLSVGSFSKILAPGLRLGWIQTSPPLQDQILELGLLKSGGGLNPFLSTVVGAALARGWQASFTDRLRQIYAHRVEILDKALQRELGDLVTYRKPEGGYFFWVELPTQVDLEAFLLKAREEKTGFQPGPRFSSCQGLGNFIRLSFARYHENALDVGVERLAKAVKMHLSL